MILTLSWGSLTSAETSDLDLVLEQQQMVIDQSFIPMSIVRLKASDLGSYLKPFWADPTQLVGLAALEDSARSQGVLAAINAGFFNRKTQQPIGAIRWQGEWISSPVLGRGVMAWTSSGEFRFERARSQGIIQTSSGTQLDLMGINTAYVLPGVSQYTPVWGSTYTTQTDDETVIEVRQNRIVALYPAAVAGSLTRGIPADGYLLVGRSLQTNNYDVYRLNIGDQITLSLQLDPVELERYPHMIGAGPLLLQAGQIVLDAELEQFQPSFRSQTAARSAICQTTVNEILFITVGQAQELTGVSLLMMAQLAQQLGCREALNLDGGSSSSLVYKGTTVNLPATPSWKPRVHNGLGIFQAPQRRLTP